MSKGQPNQSWREQRKGVVMTSVATGKQYYYISMWSASHIMADLHDCEPSTAKKEIKKAIKAGVPRYGAYWKWKDAE